MVDIEKTTEVAASAVTNATENIANTAANVAAITAGVGVIAKSTAPLLAKTLDRKYADKQKIIEIPNVVDVNKEEAKRILENLGFTVSVVVQKSEAKYSQASLDEVVEMSPNSGVAKIGSLIKIYYMDEFALMDSQTKAMAKKGQAVILNLGKGVSKAVEKITSGKEGDQKAIDVGLSHLKELFDKGLINQVDFEAEKQELLDRNNTKAEKKLSKNEAELRHLKNLLDDGLITQTDFDAEKQEILDRNNPKKISGLFGKFGKDKK